MKFWQQTLLVFIAMVALDLVFALYVIECAAKAAVPASLWAAAIQVFNIFVVSSFVRDRRLSVPCIAGAFVGTFAAIKLF